MFKITPTSKTDMVIGHPSKIKMLSHPFSVDPLMAGDEQLNNCCKMNDDLELEILSEIRTWLEMEDIDVKFSIYFGMFYFVTEEARVKFILKWL